MRRRMRTGGTAVGLSLALLSASVGVAGADNGTDTTGLQSAVTTAGITTHLQALATIASSNGNTRSAGTGGHIASAEYIFELLAATGAFNVSRQSFTYSKWTELNPPTLSVAGTAAEVDYSAMSYSGSGTATGPLVAVDLLLPPVGGSTSGCEAADFAGFPTGGIALIQRGTCTFAQKAQNAQAAGATGAIIFNEGNDADRVGLLFGTLEEGSGVTIPVVGTTFALGQQLATASPAPTVTMSVSAKTEAITTYNVLADTKKGRTDRIVVAGGHLDSVAEGAGINDNGSGTAALLEIALQMAKANVVPRNQVRFAFWSGEEDGLIGSQYYVDQLSAQDVRRHAVNLNFDMVASPNFGRFIYDGDGSASPEAGPNGSDIVEDVFEAHFRSKGLATLPTAFDGRSDYGPFIERGIPAGGLFTGAEDLKTAAEAALFGGTAGVAFDACYHAACDGIGNINTQALDEMSNAMADAILTFAQTTSAVNGTGKGQGGGTTDLLRKGQRFVK